jgi:hypothetical protein
MISLFSHQEYTRKLIVVQFRKLDFQYDFSVTFDFETIETE